MRIALALLVLWVAGCKDKTTASPSPGTGSGSAATQPATAPSTPGTGTTAAGSTAPTATSDGGVVGDANVNAAELEAAEKEYRRSLRKEVKSQVPFDETKETLPVAPPAKERMPAK